MRIAKAVVPFRAVKEKLEEAGKNARRVESAIRLEMEDICEWPTGLAISIVPRNYWIVSEAEINGSKIKARIAAPGSDWMREGLSRLGRTSWDVSAGRASRVNVFALTASKGLT